MKILFRCFYAIIIIGLLFVVANVVLAQVTRVTYQADEYPISFRQETYLKTLAYCESSGRSDIRILDSNNRYSYSAYMFQMQTFKTQGIKYGFFEETITDKELEKLIYDANLQEKIAHRMLLDGGEKNWWNCWKGALRGAKYPKI